MATAKGSLSKKAADSEPLYVESKPERQEIELRAYHIYLERGGEPGHEVEDWLQAEQELSASRNMSMAKGAAAD